MRAMLGVRLVLLDRDGTITQEIAHDIAAPDDLRLIPGAEKAIAHLNRSGIKVAICSNQEAVGRGELDLRTLAKVNERLRQLLAAGGAHLDAIYDCSDDPAHPTRRHKPSPGLLEEAMRDFDAEPALTPMIGDDIVDLQAAASLGCPRHLVRTGKGAQAERKVPGSILPVRVHDDLLDAVTSLLDVRRAILARR
jgi:D-glycero-D-manno-heptose 1,7-bisphosphate phosphatase